MRAYIVPTFGAPGAIGEVPDPQPADGELLVHVTATSVNAIDPIIATGALKDYFEHRLPLILGADFAGTVAAVGNGVRGFAVGDEVFGNAGKMVAGTGTFAELAAV